MPVRDNIFRPGELAPVSGLYCVIHLTGHRPPHEAVIIRGEELPMCRSCKREVHFEVLQTASHVTHDWDFAAPTSLSVKRHAPDEFANLRTHARHQLAVPVEVERKRGSLRGHVSDISAGGLCVFLEDRLEAADALVSLRIDVPNTDDPLVLGGLLRYRYGNRHGFLFTDLDDNAQQVVRKLLESNRRSG